MSPCRTPVTVVVAVNCKSSPSQADTSDEVTVTVGLITRTVAVSRAAQALDWGPL